MELCPICLEIGQEACACGRLYHVDCINKLLDHGFISCQCCFAPFPADFHILAAQQTVNEDNNSTRSQIKMAAALTLAGKANNAIIILKKSIAEAASPTLQSACFVELGKAYLQLGKPQQASRELYACIVLSKIVGASAMELQLRAMALLCRAYYDRGIDALTHGTAAMALRQVHHMSGREAAYIMRVLADTYKRAQNAAHYKSTLEVLCDITDAETRNDLVKATTHAELGIAEHELGVGSSTRLKPAIKTLRKHGHAMTVSAALALQAQVKPSRRMHQKTHPENVA